MSPPNYDSVTPKTDSTSTPVLPPCSVPYRWILHIGRCVSVYFDRNQPTADWNKHRHSGVQILFFGAGAECTIHWEENGDWLQEEVKGRHLWVIGVGVAHKLEWRRETLRLVFYVEPAFVNDSAGFEITGSVLLNLHLVAKCDAKIPNLLADFENMDQPSNQSESIHLESLSSLVTVRILRAWECLRNGLPRSSAGLSNRAFAQVEQLLDSRLDEKIMISEMARTVGMSESNFSRLFKRRMGITPGQFLIDRRIQKAKEMLLLDDYRIGEIALCVGFSNQGHFDVFFKRRVGLTPTEYRSAARK